MGFILMLVFFFVSFLIVGMVLLQEGKGGGLTGMSTGMDGVMGAKNPLRRMTAYLFTFFVLMCLTINWYFHQRVDTSLPSGMAIPQVEKGAGEAPSAGPLVEPGGLRPEETPAPDNSGGQSVRPDGAAAAAASSARMALDNAEGKIENAAAAAAATVSEAAAALRPDAAPEAAPVQSVRPNAGE